MLVAAFAYASVGHGGASAYLAAMALAGVAPADDAADRARRSISSSRRSRTYKFWRAGYFRWRLFWPFAVVSIPLAFVGGAITLPGHAYKILVGVVLVYAAWQLWLSARRRRDARGARAAASPLAMRSARRSACSRGSPASAAAYSSARCCSCRAGPARSRPRRLRRRSSWSIPSPASPAASPCSRRRCRRRVASWHSRAHRRLARRGIRQPALRQPAGPAACSPWSSRSRVRKCCFV